MAAAFKSYVTNNIGSTYTVVTPTVTAGAKHTVLGVSVYNVSGASNTTYLRLNKSGGTGTHTNAHFAYNLTLQAGTGFEFESGNKFVLEPGDTIECKSSSGASGILEVIYNYLELS